MASKASVEVRLTAWLPLVTPPGLTLLKVPPRMICEPTCTMASV